MKNKIMAILVIVLLVMTLVAPMASVAKGDLAIAFEKLPNDWDGFAVVVKLYDIERPICAIYARNGGNSTGDGWRPSLFLVSDFSQRRSQA